MLTLTRAVGEVIRIGENIEVCVVGINRGQVKLGISAPREIAIHRPEADVRFQMDDAASAEPDTV